MARRVNPIDARKGEFIDTFPENAKGAMLRHVDNMEKLLRNTGSKRELVYTLIVPWGKRARGTWQIYLLP